MDSRIQRILETLRELFPNPRLELTHGSPYELLIKAILAAQAPDKKVNEITPKLLTSFPTPDALALADLSEIEEKIKEINFYKRKARAIKEASSDLVERFHGQVPEALEALVTLRGVGRKTANVVRVGHLACRASWSTAILSGWQHGLGLQRPKTPNGSSASSKQWCRKKSAPAFHSFN